MWRMSDKVAPSSLFVKSSNSCLKFAPVDLQIYSAFVTVNGIENRA